MKRKALEFIIDEFSRAIDILRKNDYNKDSKVFEVLKGEKSHYVFLYKERFDICYFEKSRLKEIKQKNCRGK